MKHKIHNWRTVFKSFQQQQHWRASGAHYSVLCSFTSSSLSLSLSLSFIFFPCYFFCVTFNINVRVCRWALLSVYASWSFMVRCSRIRKSWALPLSFSCCHFRPIPRSFSFSFFSISSISPIFSISFSLSFIFICLYIFIYIYLFIYLFTYILFLPFSQH